MQRGHCVIAAQVIAEVRDMHAQLEVKLKRQTRLIRESVALIVGIIVGIQWSICMTWEDKFILPMMSCVSLRRA